MEYLLNNTQINVNVMGGTLDGIQPTPSNEKWVEGLRWSGASDFAVAPRNYIDSRDIIEGFYRATDRLSLYTVYRSGHTVPATNPWAMDFILKRIVNP